VYRNYWLRDILGKDGGSPYQDGDVGAVDIMAMAILSEIVI
jgi:hypothetical protein